MNRSPVDAATLVRLQDLLLHRPAAAAAEGDWGGIAEDFEAGSFAAYSESDGGSLVISSPTLKDYARAWRQWSVGVEHDGVTGARGTPRLTAVTVEGNVATARLELEADEAAAARPRAVLPARTTDFLLRRREDRSWCISAVVARVDRRRASPGRLRPSRAGQHVTAGPYSPAITVAAGPLVVISGQGPLDDSGAVVGSTIGEQVELTLANCQRQLEAAGASMQDVFKCTAYLSDLSLWDDFNLAYRTALGSAVPVRTTVGADLLLGMLVEIEMWAAP